MLHWPLGEVSKLQPVANSMKFNLSIGSRRVKVPQAVNGQAEIQDKPFPRDVEGQYEIGSQTLKTDPTIIGANYLEASPSKKRKREELFESPRKREKRNPIWTPENKYHCLYDGPGAPESPEASSSKKGKPTELAESPRKRENQSPPQTPKNIEKSAHSYLREKSAARGRDCTFSNTEENTIDSSDSSDSASKKHQGARRHILRKRNDNGAIIYERISPDQFDTLRKKVNASNPSVTGSDSDEGGFVHDSSDSHDSDWEHSPLRPWGYNGRVRRQRGKKSRIECKGDAIIIDMVIDSPKPSRNRVSKASNCEARDACERFQRPWQSLALETVPDPFELGRRARACIIGADYETGRVEANMDAAFDATDKQFTEAENAHIEQQQQLLGSVGGEYSPGTKPQNTDYPEQIIGTEGRPSRLMTPGKLAYFRAEEKKAKWAAEAELDYDNGVYVKGRRGPTPVLQEPRPERVLTVVADIEAWMDEQQQDIGV